jgi:hypothetical protein
MQGSKYYFAITRMISGEHSLEWVVVRDRLLPIFGRVQAYTGNTATSAGQMTTLI